AYPAPGTYTVQLSVTDKDGGTGTAQRTVVVSNLPPIARIAGPASVAQGTPAQFDGTASETQPSGGSLEYSWNSGNGSVSAAPQPTFSYLVPGSYTVSLTVTDAAGGGTGT